MVLRCKIPLFLKVYRDVYSLGEKTGTDNLFYCCDEDGQQVRKLTQGVDKIFCRSGRGRTTSQVCNCSDGLSFYSLPVCEKNSVKYSLLPLGGENRGRAS